MWTLLQWAIAFAFVRHQVAFAQNDCGNTSFSGNDGVVSSPNFPLPYPHNISCTYSIDVGQNNSVLLRFLYFDLELPVAGNCTRDWLMITCKETETDDENLDFRKRYCGTTVPRTFLRFFNCPVVELKFFADSSVSGGGFSIGYSVLENSTSADSVIDCGDTVFTSSSGFIRLPSNPTEYSASVNCTYTISTNRSSTFFLGVLFLQLPDLLDSFEDCNRDYVMVGCVSDGETELNANTSDTYCRSSFDGTPVQHSRFVFSNCSIVKISIRSSDYNYRGTNSIPFTVSTYDTECGAASYTGSTGIVTSPKFPLPHPHSLNCFYFINVDRTKTVYLDFLSFSLEESSSSSTDRCSYDWLTISCLSRPTGFVRPAYPSQNEKYCGLHTKQKTLTYSNCDSLILNFRSDSSVARGGFAIRYTITSPGNTTTSRPGKERGNVSFSGVNGFITSPRFPLSYPNNADFLYSIEVDRRKSIGLYSYSFDLEGTSASNVVYLDDCRHDWLLISCFSAVSASYHQNRKYCGAKTTPLVLSYSYCDSFTLNFVSDSSVTREGFKIWYTVKSTGESSCGNTSFSGSNGVITSPNFPLQYPYNFRCTHSINVDRNSAVQLKFRHFDLGAPDSAGYCSNDWLKITCNETTKSNPYNNRKYCGAIQWTSSLRFVDCNTLTLQFFSASGAYIIGAGYMIDYTVVENANYTDNNSELDCGTTLFTNSTGVISLPRNPKNFLATVNCTYTISTNQTSVIWLNTYFSTSTQLLQSFQDCSKENLMIGCVSEGATAMDSRTTRVFCRRGPSAYSISWSPLVFADCRKLKVSIFSNTYDYRDTFSIPFSAIGPDEICGNTSFSDPVGTVATPRLPFSYSTAARCLYTIDSGQVSPVVLMIDRLEFGSGSLDRYCRSGWLTITCMVNGTSVAHPLANRKLCGTVYPNPARFPACESVLLNFSSNDLSYPKGLTIRYRIGDHELNCGTTLFNGSSGNINLPRNPTNYPAAVNCTYTISTNQTSTIFLNTFLYSSMPLLQSFQDCSKENLTIGCASEGQTELNPTTSKTFCRQERPSYDDGPPSFDDDDDDDYHDWSNPRDYRRYLYEYRRSAYDHRPSRSSSSSLVFTDCHALKLIVRSSAYVYRDAFHIPFSVFGPDAMCGNTSYSAPNGTVSSPRMRFQLSRPVNCLYTIDVANGSSVVLNIDRLIFGYQYTYYTDTSCRDGWLIITCLVNGTSIAHPLAGRKLCQNLQSSMSARFPACQTVLFNYSVNEISEDKGFTVGYRIGDYEIDCGSTLISGSSGVISLPRNPTNYLATAKCTYTISTNRTGHIILDLASISHSNQFLQSFQDCSKDNLTVGCISEGGTELNPNTTMVFCRRSTSQYYYISESQRIFYDCRTLKMFVRSNTYGYYSAHTVAHRFPFSVFGSDEICGNTSFSALAGIVSTRQLSFSYLRRVSCLYTIDSGDINSVVLSIDRLYLGSAYDRNGSCNSGGWLTITCMSDGGESVAHPLADKKLCGNHEPTVARFSACRSVVLNFSSDHTSSEKGITIRYRMGDYDAECGNTSFSGPTGFITSPRFPLSYPHNLNCLYSIAGGERTAISLSFLSFRLDGRSNTPLLDYCYYSDYLTVSCLSDESVLANFSSIRKYCGIKTTPLKFEFSSCAAVVLNFRSNLYVSEGGFRVRYTVIDTDTICGVPAYGRPSGVIRFPSNYTVYNGSLNCNYVINATEPSSISLTISSTSLQSSLGSNCQRDWLFITCIDGQLSLHHNMTHRSCDSLNSSTQLTFPGCVVAQVVFHRDVAPTGRTFRIDYMVTNYGDNVPTTTELPSTSISATEPVRTDKIPATKYTSSQTPTKSLSTEIPVTRSTKCEASCKLSADGTTCDCSTTKSDTSQTQTRPASKEIPVTRGAKCEVDCKLNADGTTCDCSTAPSGDLVALNLSGHRGRDAGISLTVILLVIGAICLAAFLLFKRQRKRNLPEMLIPNEAQMELEDDSNRSESIFRSHRNQDQDTSKYLPLRPVSIGEKPSSSSGNTREMDEDIRAGL